MLVNIKVAVTPSYCNDWPFFKITLNDEVIWDDQVLEPQTLEFSVECKEKNTLSFEHYGKRFGEDGVWDTTETEDRFIRIDDLQFDDVTVGDKLKQEWVFKTNFTECQDFNEDIAEINTFGSMNFNGVIDTEFETPVYNWLIFAKYKEDLDEDMAFFSNYTARWHYEKDLELIQEIRKLLNV